MRIRLRWLVVVVLLAPLLVPKAASAHDHTADVFAAFFSYAHASNLWGFHSAVAKTIPGHKKFSIVGDLTRHAGTHDDTDLTKTAYMFGVRYMRAEIKKKHVPFAQVLVGGLRSSGDLPSDTDLAVALGGGYEYLPQGHNSAGGLAIRVLIDVVISGDDKGPRVSTGLVYRFVKSTP